jgi:fumarate hydratase class II
MVIVGLATKLRGDPHKGQEFTAYGAAFRQARHQIQAGAKLLEGLGIGGSAVGTGLNAHPRFPCLVLRRLVVHTGLNLKVADDLRAAMQSQLPAAAVSGSLRNLALELIRIANDLRLLASGPMTGLNEIALPTLQPGSSIKLERRLSWTRMLTLPGSWAIFTGRKACIRTPFENSNKGVILTL